MNIQTEKLELIEWIIQQENTSLLQQLIDIKKTFEDPKVELSNHEKQAVQEAVDTIKSQGTISHEEVIEETKQRYAHLFKS